MAKQPIERKIMSAPEMAMQLEASQADNKLYGGRKGKQYNEVSAELRQEALQGAIDQQLTALKDAEIRGKVDLNDVEQVKAAAFRFMEACRASGTFPTMLAFSASMGVSRQRVYAYTLQHPKTPTTEFLDALRSSWASILAQASLTRQTDNATSLFLLKNSGQGLQDRVDIAAVTPTQPLSDEITAEDVAAKYAELPAD